MTISTVFEVKRYTANINGQFQLEAVGQDACNAIRKEFPKKKIMLLGFQVSGKFIPVNLN